MGGRDGPAAVLSAGLRLAPVLLLYLGVCAVAQPGPEAVRDEPALLAAAERLVEEGRLAGAGSDPDQRAFLWHGPGLVALLAPLVALGVPLDAMRLLSPVLLFAAVLAFRAALGARLGARAGHRWALVLALYAPFVVVLGTLQKEPLAVLLVVLTMGAAVPALRDGHRTAMVAAGLGLAALTLVRLEYGWVTLVLLAAAGLWWAVRRRRTPVPGRCAGIAAVAAVACVPWLVHTHDLTGQPLYWGASSGLSLFWMAPTLPGETGQWHSPVRVHSDPALAPYRPMFRRLDAVHPLASDLELRRRAVGAIRDRPAEYARNLAANALRLVAFAPTRPPQPPAFLALYGLANGALLAAVAVAGRRLWRRRGRLPAETAPFALFAVLAVGVHLPPSASPRMLMPVVPVLLWLVAHGRRAPGAIT